MGKLRDKLRERLIRKIEKEVKRNSEAQSKSNPREAFLNDCDGIQPTPPVPAEESAQIEAPALSATEMMEELLEKVAQMENPALAATEVIEGMLEEFAEEKSLAALLAMCFTIHHMMKFDVQFIFPAKITKDEDGNNIITFATINFDNGTAIAAFTNQKEYENAKNKDDIPFSGTITRPIESMMQEVMDHEQVIGIVLNPGKDTIILNKDIIKIILSPNIEEDIKNMMQ